MSVQLRPINETDRDIVFLWRNDPFIVERSTSRRNVSLEEHKTWFNRLLANKDVLAFIIEDEGQPIGHIRFKLENDCCIITIYLLQENTGKGYGVDAIQTGCKFAQDHWPKNSIVAYVRKDNALGRSGFLKAGFSPSNEPCPSGHIALVLNRNVEEHSTSKRYRQLFNKHGKSHKTLNWGSQEGQRLRFKILAEIGRLEGKRILDVGCGLGDFAGWLAKNNIQADYTGLDLTPELVKQAQKNYPALAFVQGSILDESLLVGQRFDFVLASGIFYTYSTGGGAWLRAAVARMWSLCKDGVAFNSLSAWSEGHEAGEYYADPPTTLAYCRTLTPWVAMRHDYHPRDFTIYLSRMARE